MKNENKTFGRNFTHYFQRKFQQSAALFEEFENDRLAIWVMLIAAPLAYLIWIFHALKYAYKNTPRVKEGSDSDCYGGDGWKPF